jgi:hypothetical protein
MQDLKDQRIYCAEQIYVPDELPVIMKNFSKAIIRNQPKNLVKFSLDYFKEQYENQNNNNDEYKNSNVKPDEKLIKKEFEI